MKKHTSKSASATPGASSRSGTSAKTAATGKVSHSSLAQNKFGHVLVKARKRTPAQALHAMVLAGIVTEAGELTSHYKAEPKGKKKSKA